MRGGAQGAMESVSRHFLSVDDVDAGGQVAAIGCGTQHPAVEGVDARRGTAVGCGVCGGDAVRYVAAAVEYDVVAFGGVCTVVRQVEAEGGERRFRRGGYEGVTVGGGAGGGETVEREAAWQLSLADGKGQAEPFAASVAHDQPVVKE